MSTRYASTDAPEFYILFKDVTCIPDLITVRIRPQLDVAHTTDKRTSETATSVILLFNDKRHAIYIALNVKELSTVLLYGSFIRQIMTVDNSNQLKGTA